MNIYPPSLYKQYIHSAAIKIIFERPVCKETINDKIIFFLIFPGNNPHKMTDRDKNYIVFI